jgi:hypothetical protein
VRLRRWWRFKIGVRDLNVVSLGPWGVAGMCPSCTLRGPFVSRFLVGRVCSGCAIREEDADGKASW